MKKTTEIIKELFNLIEKTLLDLDKESKTQPNPLKTTELRKDIYKNRIISGSKKLDKLSKEHCVSRQNIQQIEAKILLYLNKKFEDFNPILNKLIEKAFKQDQKILPIDDEIIKSINTYRNIINRYWNNNFESIRIFNIDLNRKIIYDRQINIEKLFESTIKHLNNFEAYDITSIAKQLEKELETISYNTNTNKVTQASKLLAPYFCDEYVAKHHLIDVSDKNMPGYICAHKKVTNREYHRQQFLYWFRQCYPYGVALPQRAEKLGFQRLQILIDKIPKLEKYHNYRSFLNNKISSEPEIALYNNGSYISFDNFRRAYEANEKFISDFLDILLPILNNGYTSIKPWTIFTVRAIRREFIKIGIPTYEVLYNILRAANSPRIKLHCLKKALLITKAGVEDKDVNIKFEERKYVGVVEFPKLLSFLKNAKFNKVVDFNYICTKDEDALEKHIKKYQKEQKQ